MRSTIDTNPHFSLMGTVVRTRRIATSAPTIVIATLIVSSRLTPVYESTATIDVDGYTGEYDATAHGASGSACGSSATPGSPPWAATHWRKTSSAVPSAR